MLEHVEMKFDGGFLTKMFGIENDVPLITPFKKQDSNKYELSAPVLAFGLTASVLPLIVGMILQIARR